MWTKSRVLFSLKCKNLLITPLIKTKYLNLRTMSSDAKKGRISMEGDTTSKMIGTHNGVFHCDDALACSMLKMLPEFKDAVIVRTRDETTLCKCDAVVDVGGVYDPLKNRFDHHQRSFVHTLNSLKSNKKWTMKLSSAGLVFAHHGHEILSMILGTKPDDDITDVVFDKVYENFIQEIDAIDNGVDICDGEKRYEIHTNLSRRVSYLNPSWNEKGVDIEELWVSFQSRFHAAMQLVAAEFTDCVMSYKLSWLPARDIVVTAVNKRFQVDEGGEIMHLDPFCPWKDHLFTMEEEGRVNGPLVKFVLYEDIEGLWRVLCVPAARNTFQNRLSLLKSWCGLRNEDLCSVTGIDGCTFVHAGGFIGGNRTYGGVLEMARETLRQSRVNMKNSDG